MLSVRWVFLFYFNIVNLIVFFCFYTGVSAVSNALARYINSLSGNKIESVLKAHLPIHVPYLAEFPNFLALGLALMVTCAFMSKFFELYYI
jgi:hypothetical protein